MTLEEVEILLGKKGVETVDVPGIVDWEQPEASPKRVKAVVTAEKILRWEEGSRYILVGFDNGLVTGKWYWEPSF
jgi:hypothetical protein